MDDVRPPHGTTLAAVIANKTKAVARDMALYL